MDAKEYQKLIEEKVEDAWYNYEQAERRFKAAKSVYDAANEELRKFKSLQLREWMNNDR